MDRVEAAVGDLVRRTAEAQLQAAEDSVAELVRQEVAALAAVARLSVLPLGAGGVPDTWQSGTSRSSSRMDFSPSEGRTGGLEDVHKTIWEAVVIVGLPELGFVDTVILFFGFVSTLSIQAFICNAVGNGFGWKPPGARGRQIWRDLDTAPLLPVVNDACPVGTSDEACLALLNLAPGNSHNEDPYNLAALFCMVGVVVWILLVGREMMHIVVWTRSIWALPRRSTRFLWLGNRFMLVSIGHFRLLLVFLLSFVRMGVALSLLAVGLRQLFRLKSPHVLLILVAVLGFALDVPRRAASHFYTIHSFNRSLRG